MLVVILVLGGIGSINRNKKEKFDWDEVELCDRLPKPKSNVGTIIGNDSDHLSLHIEKTSNADYKAYIEECQSMDTQSRVKKTEITILRLTKMVMA